MISYEQYEDRLPFYTKLTEISGPYRNWQMSLFQPYVGRRVADLGCGVGNFAELLLDRDLYVGVEMDPEMIGYMRSTYPPDKHPNIEFIQADISSSECLAALKERAVDTVMSLNVIEHIEDDVTAINLMLDALPKGGCLCLLVPAFKELYGTLDQIDYHFRRYTKADLIEKLDNRVEVVRLHYFNLIGAFGWLLKGRILKQKGHTEENYTIINFLSRFMKPIEERIRIPFGLSLVLVARKV